MQADRFLKVSQVAEMLNIAPKTIYNRCGRKSSNPLPFRVIRLGKSVRFSEKEILQFCGEGGYNVDIG